MNTWDFVILFINVVVTIVSIVGAIKSNRYYRKSKHITVYAQINRSFNELEEMLKKLPEALAAASRVGKGYSPENTVQEIGTAMANHFNIIMKAIPSDYAYDFSTLPTINTSEIEQYINSLIDGTAFIEEKGRKMLERKSFDKCQERLRVMQKNLKEKITVEEEKLK